jgi:3-hydroxyisobutyrate dehydrogenase-like beta-hydroxyacid dehydrogenase
MPEPSARRARAGFVGLGHMGRPMALNLLRNGFEVVLFDRDASRARALAGEGGRPAASLAEVAAMSEVIFLSLPGPADVLEVALGPEGLIASMRPGSALVCLSTVSRSAVERVAEAAAAKGIGIVDAPVTGAADGAAAGTLTVMVGAEPAQLERVRPLLEAISTRVVHVGPVGAGSAAKLLTNMLWFVHVVALADALALGARAGIPIASLAELIPASAGGSWVAEHDLPHLLRGDDDASFTLALCTKDLGLIEELADELALAAPLARCAAERFARAHERYGGAAGELAVARLSEEEARVSIRLAGHG